MENYIDKNYELIKESRKPYDVDINHYRQMITNYYRNIMGKDLLTVRKNINNVDNVFTCDLEQVTGSRLVCWHIPDSTKSEVYIDKNFIKGNEKLCDEQITHELLHSLCYKSGYQMLFGHPFIDQSSLVYEGITEAVTQVYTEDINNSRLTEEVDYIHYFIKNIMRIMNTIFDKKLIASQYLGDSNDFENRFNMLVNNSFNTFVYNINKMYNFHIKMCDRKLTYNEQKDFEACKEYLFKLVKKLIHLAKQYNPDIEKQIKEDLMDDAFLEQVFYEKPKPKTKNRSNKKNH